MRLTSPQRRSAMSTLEVIMTAAVGVPAASALYLLFEMVMNHFFFMLGNVVGSPLM